MGNKVPGVSGIQRILKFSVAFICVCLYSTGYLTKWGTIPLFLYTVLKAKVLYVQFEISTMVQTMSLNTWQYMVNVKLN